MPGARTVPGSGYGLHLEITIMNEALLRELRREAKAGMNIPAIPTEAIQEALAGSPGLAKAWAVMDAELRHIAKDAVTLAKMGDDAYAALLEDLRLTVRGDVQIKSLPHLTTWQLMDAGVIQPTLERMPSIHVAWDWLVRMGAFWPEEPDPHTAPNLKITDYDYETLCRLLAHTPETMAEYYRKRGLSPERFRWDAFWEVCGRRFYSYLFDYLNAEQVDSALRRYFGHAKGTDWPA